MLLDLLSLGNADSAPIIQPLPSIPLFEGTQNSLLDSLSDTKVTPSTNGSTTGQGGADLFSDFITPTPNSDPKGKR